MIEDTRSDEQLVTDHFAGNKEALGILLTRYQEPIWHYLRWKSWYKKDKSYLDDIRQKVLVVIFNRIREGKFTDKTEGSFKKWVDRIAQLEILKSDERRRHEPAVISTVYPEALPSDIVKVSPQASDYHQISARLAKVLSYLSEEERQLLLLSDKDYNEIHKIPPFDKYELPNLRQKICRLRKFVISLKNKGDVI